MPQCYSVLFAFFFKSQKVFSSENSSTLVLTVALPYLRQLPNGTTKIGSLESTKACSRISHTLQPQFKIVEQVIKGIYYTFQNLFSSRLFVLDLKTVNKESQRLINLGIYINLSYCTLLVKYKQRMPVEMFSDRRRTEAIC